MADDSYETVAITYGQPETAVMLSMFAWYGVPAYASGQGHAQIWPFIVALGGIEVRVHADSVADARALLAEVAQRPPAVRPRMTHNPVTRTLGYAIALLSGFPIPSRAGSTFFLGDRA